MGSVHSMMPLWGCFVVVVVIFDSFRCVRCVRFGREYLLGKLALDAAHVLLQHLPVADLMLHLAGLLRAATEQQQTAGEPIEPMDGAQILQIVLFGQYEDDGVVAIPAARMHLGSGPQRERERRKHAEHAREMGRQTQKVWNEFTPTLSQWTDLCLSLFISETGLVVGGVVVLRTTDYKHDAL